MVCAIPARRFELDVAGTRPGGLVQSLIRIGCVVLPSTTRKTWDEVAVLHGRFQGRYADIPHDLHPEAVRWKGTHVVP